MAKKKGMKINWKAFVLLAAIFAGLIAAMALFAKPSFKISGAWDCDKYNIYVARDGLVTVVNDSVYAEAATGVEVYIDGVLAATLTAPALAQGQRADIGGVPVPANGVFIWRAVAVADRNCTDSGSYEGTPTTPTPTPTGISIPTPTPTPTPVACKVEVDFEKNANGVRPTDNMLASRNFAHMGFTMKNPASNIIVPAGACASTVGPRIAAIGSPRTAFQGYGGVDDTVEPWSRSGNFVLTDDGKLSPTSTYKYACTIRFDMNAGYYGRIVSLDVLDIDKEGYVVRGYNSVGRQVATSTVSPTIKGNGIAYKVTLVAPEGEKIAAVEVVPNKFTKTDGWGWGIDNICVKD